MSEGYMINFATTLDPERLADLVKERWGINPAGVFVGAPEDIGPGPKLDIMILTGEFPGSDFDVDSTQATHSPRRPVTRVNWHWPRCCAATSALARSSPMAACRA